MLYIPSYLTYLMIHVVWLKCGTCVTVRIQIEPAKLSFSSEISIIVQGFDAYLYVDRDELLLKWLKKLILL